MGNDKKRQIKKEKIQSTLADAKYSVREWYIDTSNIVYAFLVRNDVNNIEFVCYIPENILMTVDNGLYCTETESPDFTLATQMWNEIGMDFIAVKVFGGMLFKYEKDWVCFSVSQDKQKGQNNNDIEQLSANFIALDESTATIVTDNPAVEIAETNPFDTILDGGDYKIQGPVNERVEDSQPCILVNYKGFTYGQAVPSINIMTFMNELKGFEIKLSKMNKEILQYQYAKIKTSSTEALGLLKRFTESLDKSVKDWEAQWQGCSDLLSRVHMMLEQSKETKTMNDMNTKANNSLRETTEFIIAKRDALLALLNTCRDVFSQV